MYSKRMKTYIKMLSKLQSLRDGMKNDFFPIFQVFYMKAGQCLKDSVLFANRQVSLLQFHRRSQKTRDSWVRDEGPYPSQDVR